MSTDFSLAGTDRVFTAEYFAEPWEGWAVPVVTRDVVNEVVTARPGAELVWDGDAAVIDGEQVRPYLPGSDRYILEIGWDFRRVFPAGAPTQRFEIDGYPAADDEEFFAYGFDEPWNGFDQPVVDQATLMAVVATAGSTAVLSWGGETAVVNGDGYLVELPPDANGHYHLRPLGWCFTGVEEW